MNTTIRAEAASETSFWNDHASVLRRDAADGIFHGLASLYSGTFADMVLLFTHLSEDERAGLVIEKSGDRQYSAAEIAQLARRTDFPRKTEF